MKTTKTRHTYFTDANTQSTEIMKQIIASFFIISVVLRPKTACKRTPCVNTSIQFCTSLKNARFLAARVLGARNC